MLEFKRVPILQISYLYYIIHPLYSPRHQFVKNLEPNHLSANVIPITQIENKT